MPSPDGHGGPASRWTARVLELAVLLPWASVGVVWIFAVAGGLVTGDRMRFQSFTDRWLTLLLLLAVMVTAVEILTALVLRARRRRRPRRSRRPETSENPAET